MSMELTVVEQAAAHDVMAEEAADDEMDARLFTQETVSFGDVASAPPSVGKKTTERLEKRRRAEEARRPAFMAVLEGRQVQPSGGGGTKKDIEMQAYVNSVRENYKALKARRKAEGR